MTTSVAAPHSQRWTRWAARLALGSALLGLAACSGSATAPPTHAGGGEANLALPDLGQVTFWGFLNGRTLLWIGLLISISGLFFGLVR